MLPLGDNGNFLCFVHVFFTILFHPIFSLVIRFSILQKNSLLQKLIVQEKYLTLKNGKKYCALSEKESYKNITFLLQYFQKN